MIQNMLQRDSQLVPEKENKVVGIAQSVTRFKPIELLWKELKIKIHKKTPPESSRFKESLFRRMIQNTT